MLQQWEGALPGRRDALLRLAPRHPERRAQRVVTRDDALERAAQHLAIQLASQAAPPGRGVPRADAARLLQRPEPLLREGERQAPAPAHGLDGRQLRVDRAHRHRP
jgi:hypothetical protein